MYCFLGVLLAVGALPPAAGAQNLPLYTMIGDGSDDTLRSIDPLTGEVLAQVAVTLAGHTVEGANGFAIHPDTGVLYAVLRLTGQTGRELVTINPATGVATSIGDTGHRFAGIAFRKDADDEVTLYGVTGDGDTDPATLFTINTTTGAATMVLALGTEDDDGEALAYNPETDLLYHASGLPLSVFETINPDTLARSSLTLAGPDDPDEPLALTHWRGDFFFLSDLDQNTFVVRVSGSDAEFRALSSLDHTAKAAVFAGEPPACPATVDTLYGAANQGPDGPSLFYALDPATGGRMLVGPIGFERVSGMAYSRGAILFATGERMDGSDTSVLLTIDPCTGLGTEVGPTNMEALGFAIISDISFSPASGELFALAWNSGTDTTHLLRLNTSTGAATAVGQTFNFGVEGGALAFSSADILYEADETNLNTISPTTGAPTFVAALDFPAPADSAPRVNGMAFHTATGDLFGSINDGTAGSPENYLGTIDVTDGTVTLVSNNETQPGLDAVAFPPFDFSLSFENSTVTVEAGETVEVVLHVVPGPYGFDQEIDLSVGELPEGVSASFDQNSVTPGDETVDVTLTLNTSNSRLGPGGRPGPAPWPLAAPLLGAALAATMLAWLALRRREGRARRLAMSLPLVAAMLCGLALAGCASDETPPGSHDIEVTATSGEITHTSTLTLVVE